MNCLEKVNKIRQGKPEKKELGQWPPPNASKDAAYYTVKETGDALANAMQLPLDTPEQKAEFPTLLRKYLEIGIILESCWPDGVKRALRHCFNCGHHPKHTRLKWVCPYCGERNE